MAVFGGSLIVSGSFSDAGGVPTDNIARFDGESWFAFPGPGGGKLHVHEGSLYMTGDFPPSRVARWDGEQWQPVGSMGPNVAILCLASHNSDLIAGGVGGLGAPGNIFRWDGESWQPMGPPFANPVRAIASFDGELIAGGPALGIARWDGSAWVDLGGGLSPNVSDLAVRNNELIVAGQFSLEPAPNPVRHIARWNGSSWLPLGGGIGNSFAIVEDSVVALGAYQGELLAGGWFTVADGRPNAFWAHWGCDCYANCDGSGQPPILNVGDFACFLNRFAAADPYANCDGSSVPPVLNVSDFACFLNAFAAGCS
jgi:hypothetical protein